MFGQKGNKKPFCFVDSEEADVLAKLKESTAEEQQKLNKRRHKFQAQDSVLVEAMGKSLEEEWKFYKIKS